MKKIISVVLTLVMALSVLPAYAENTDESQGVLLSVKERIPDTLEFEEFQSSVMEGENFKVYSFDWHSESKNKSMSVTAYDNGIITGYRYYDKTGNNSQSKPSINKMLSDEAMKKAQKLANALNPMIGDKIRVEKMTDREDLFSDTYAFRLQRYENDIPVYGNIGYISVNSDGTQILRYNINYSYNITFDKPNGIIDENSVWNYYYENAGVDCLYTVDDENEKKARIVYAPGLSDNEFINALSGEVMPIWNDNYYGNSNSAMKEEFTADAEAGGGGSLCLYENELAKLEEIAGLKTSVEARKAIETNEILDIDKDLKFVSANLYKDMNSEEYYYYISYEANDGYTYKYANARLDAKTLDILYWKTRSEDYIKYRESYREKVYDEKWRTLAENALSMLTPKYFSQNTQYRSDEIEETNKFGYTRYINGIKFEPDTINIEINPENGKVWSFSINNTDIEFPLPDGIISEREAVQRLSEKSDMTLYHFTTAGKTGDKTALLGYKSENVGVIDAMSGEVGIKEDDENFNYTDISNHYAKNEIETLAKFGIGFDGDEYKPDEVITLNEYISLLVSALVYYSPITLKQDNKLTNEYMVACENGVISGDEKADEPLNRENAAIYMIRTLNLEEVAKLQSIYKPYFEDVTDNVGYISILGAMGVFNGDENGRFNPDKLLTRADAAIVIYNYLAR